MTATSGFVLGFEALLAALLVATIVYASVLSRRLAAWRDAGAEMERVIGTLAEQIGRAERGVRDLKLAAEQTGKPLAERLARAETLREDLAFLVERGEVLAVKLEEALRQARGKARQAQIVPSEAPPAPERRIESEAERMLRQAIGSAR